MKVRNMRSPNGNEVPNQFIISHNDIMTFCSGTQDVFITDSPTVFQSYESVIAVKCSASVVLDRDKWNYSVTTSKYRNQFLGETTKETEAKIKSGEYVLADLN